MKYSDFEKHIASELGQAEDTVQMDSLLAALDLNDKSQGRKPFGVLIILPFLLLAGALFYFGSGSFTEDSAKLSDKIYSENQSKSLNQINQDDSDFTTTEKLQSTETNKTSLTSESDTRINEISTSIVNQNKRDLSKQNNGAASKYSNNSEILNKDLSSINSEQGSSTSDVSETKGASEMSYLMYTESGFSDDALRIKKSQITDDKSRDNLESKTKTRIEAYSPNLNSSSVSVSSKQQNDINRTKISRAEEKSIKRVINVDLLTRGRRMLDIAELQDDSDDLFTRMKINCPSFNQAQWRLALVPEVGIFAPFKTLALKRAGTDSTPSFEKRKADEQTLEGTNIGLYGMLVRDKLPIFLKAGLSYTKISERMELEYNYTEVRDSFGVISQTVSQNGEVITTVEGPILVETTYTGKNRRHHYIHLLDMPVSLGYTTYIGGFDIAIEGGVKINLMTRATGNQLISQKGYSNLSFSQSFKRRIGSSYFGGLMVGRNFGRFGDFYLAPRFHYYPEDFTSAINPVSQKYMSIGINAGVIYKIK